MTVSRSVLPADAVFAACPAGPVSGAWRTAIERGLGLTGEHLRPGQALAVWTADLLRREVARYPDGVTLWLTDSGVPGVAWAAMTDAADDGPPPVVSIADGTTVGVHGAPAPFDMATGKLTPKTVWRDWFHTTVFNLRALYQLCLGRAEKWIEQQPKSGPTPTPPPSAS